MTTFQSNAAKQFKKLVRRHDRSRDVNFRRTCAISLYFSSDFEMVRVLSCENTV